MSFDQPKLGQIVWAILLIAMGMLLCVKTPYAIREAPGSWFLSFARYFIAVALIGGGLKKLYTQYFSKPEESSGEQ